MHEMHVLSVQRQQVRSPVPAVGRLERHLGIRSPWPPPSTTRPGRLPLAPRRASSRPRSSARSPTGVGASRSRRTVVSVASGASSVERVLVGKPRVFQRSVPTTVRGPVSAPRRCGHRLVSELSAPTAPQRGPSRESGAALLHDISDGRSSVAPDLSPDRAPCSGPDARAGLAHARALRPPLKRRVPPTPSAARVGARKLKSVAHFHGTRAEAIVDHPPAVEIPTGELVELAGADIAFDNPKDPCGVTR